MVRNVLSRMAMTGAAALVLAGAFSAPAQAQADPNAAEIASLLAGRGDCPAEYACLWVHRDWQGDRWQGRYNNGTLPSFINNKASSSYNNGRSCTVHFATGTWYSGQIMAEGLGSYRQDLSLDPKPGGGNWNDDFESMYWCSH
ncbi:peptidase inhibitor family I36 protein [Longispora albida]|uniref:peptidase inhibitor family I36 protein n=1 Tax=Longispora albida TaxID=203523 RepID=UPI0003785620|nr:peptidase inhibitor family I36 protein [Longispora albida]